MEEKHNIMVHVYESAEQNSPIDVETRGNCQIPSHGLSHKNTGKTQATRLQRETNPAPYHVTVT
jgi:hypothetical protein